MELDHKHVKYNMSGVFRLAAKFLKYKVMINMVYKPVNVLTITLK